MNKLDFGAPLYLYVDGARPELGMTELLGVDDGLAALHGGDVGRYRFAPGARRSSRSRAEFHPRPDKTEAARSTLRRLAFAAGALATIRGGAS